MSRRTGGWPLFFRSLRPVKPATPPDSGQTPEQPPEQDAPEQEENQHE